MTKIDYTSISSNVLRNRFYRYLREVLYIKSLHEEANSIIFKIDNEITYIKDKKIEISKMEESKKNEKWHKKLVYIGIFIAVLSIPFKDIYDLVSIMIK